MKKIKIRGMEEYSDNFLNIYPAEDFIPEWYRNSPPKIKNANTELMINNPMNLTSTYKKCTPFLDALSSGYIVALSADIEVVIDDNEVPRIIWRTGRNIVASHDVQQWDGLPYPSDCFPFVFIWNNQFSINTPAGYSLLFTQPLNRFDLPFESISGIVDADLYNLAIGFPFFIKKGFSGIIKKGTPIVQIIPIKREDWERQYINYDKNFSITEKEKFRSTIKRSYKNNFWNRKKYK